MKDKIACILIVSGMLALYKEQILSKDYIELLKDLFIQYWPYCLIIAGILLWIPNKSKKS